MNGSISLQREKRLLVLDGLRATCILAMMFYHVVYFLGGRVEPERFGAVVATFWGGAILQLHFSMDAFFVLSGILIGRILFLEAAQARSRPRRFYVRRAFRILPIYLFSLTVWGLVFMGNFQNIWANLLFVNNALPPTPIFMPWSWSLAVEEQFYLAAPLIIPWIARRRQPMLWLVALLIPAMCYEYARLRAAGVHALPSAHPALGAGDFWNYFTAVYTRTLSRYFGIALGVGAAWLLVNGNLAAIFSSRPRLAGWVTWGGVAAMAAQIGLAPLFSAPDAPWAFAYAVSYRWFFCVAAACTVLPSLVEAPFELAVDRFLSRSFWRPIAEFSYAMYLFHPMILHLLYAWLPHPLRTDGLSVLGYMGMLTALTVAVSAIAYSLIEKPLRLLGRRWSEKV